MIPASLQLVFKYVSGSRSKFPFFNFFRLLWSFSTHRVIVEAPVPSVIVIKYENDVFLRRRMRILLKESDGLAKWNRGKAIPTCGWGVGHGVPACQILSLCCVVWVMLGNYDFFSNYWGVGHWVPAYHILNLCSVFCKFCLAMVICFQIIGGWGTEYL